MACKGFWNGGAVPKSLSNEQFAGYDAAGYSMFWCKVRGGRAWLTAVSRVDGGVDLTSRGLLHGLVAGGGHSTALAGRAR